MSCESEDGGDGKGDKRNWQQKQEALVVHGRVHMVVRSYREPINEIFLKLFDLERAAFMFIGLIDTRRKLQLIKKRF